MKRFFCNYKSCEEGATAIEFAILSSAFFLLLFGIIEASRLVWTMNGVQYALEETGRYASLHPETALEEIQTMAEQELVNFMISSSELNIVSYAQETSNGADFVELQADYTYSTMLSGFLPGDFGEITFAVNVRKPVIS